MLCLQHAPVHLSLHLLAMPPLRTCHRPLRPCRPSLATQAIRPVTRLRPPAPPPPRSARHLHSHHLFSHVCRMLCLQHAPVRPSLHLLAVPALRTCHRPFRLCRLSLATQTIRPVTRFRPPAPPPSRSARHPHSHRLFSRVCRMLCLQHAPVRPSLHLLAMPALHTCHRPLRPCCPSLATQTTHPVTQLRPPAPLPPRSARHPHLYRSLSCARDPQHMPALPPLYLPLVPVTRTGTVLLAVSATLSTGPLAHPSTFSQCPSTELVPFSQPYLQPSVCAHPPDPHRSRRAHPMHTHPYRPASAAHARLSVPPGRACIPPSIWQWPTPVPRLHCFPWLVPADRPTALCLCVACHPPPVNRHRLFPIPLPRGSIEHLSPDSTELHPLHLLLVRSHCSSFLSRVISSFVSIVSPLNADTSWCFFLAQVSSLVSSSFLRAASACTI